jgi:hypothetical protein
MVFVAMTLLVRDEADIIAATIEHHLAAGVDLIMATDNGSVDGTTDILRAYQHAGVLELLHQPAHDYRQAEWVTTMARRAATVHNATWVINADADEFFWPTDSDIVDHTALPDSFQGLEDGCGGVIVHRDNLVADPSASGPWPHRLVLRDSLSLSPRGTRIGPKFCHAADPLVTVAAGNHTATGPRIGPPSEKQPLRILHTPDRGYSQYHRKIRNGGSAYAANTTAGPEVGWHWREDYDRLLAGTLAQTYADRQRGTAETTQQLTDGHLVRDTRLRDHLHNLLPHAVLPDLLHDVLH